MLRGSSDIPFFFVIHAVQGFPGGSRGISLLGSRKGTWRTFTEDFYELGSDGAHATSAPKHLARTSSKKTTQTLMFPINLVGNFLNVIFHQYFTKFQYVPRLPRCAEGVTPENRMS